MSGRWAQLPDDPTAADGTPPRGEYADRWSRAAGVVGGLEEWSDLLVEWAGRTRGRAERSAKEQEREDERALERTTEAKRIGTTLQRLYDRMRPDATRT